MTAAPVLRMPRVDALPEDKAYPDTGCSLHSKCLTCPLAECAWDRVRGVQSVRADETRRRILELHADGQKPPAIAEALQVSKRLVFRRMAEAATMV